MGRQRGAGSRPPLRRYSSWCPLSRGAWHPAVIQMAAAYAMKVWCCILGPTTAVMVCCLKLAACSRVGALPYTFTYIWVQCAGHQRQLPYSTGRLPGSHMVLVLIAVAACQVVQPGATWLMQGLQAGCSERAQAGILQGHVLRSCLQLLQLVTKAGNLQQGTLYANIHACACAWVLLQLHSCTAEPGPNSWRHLLRAAAITGCSLHVWLFAWRWKAGGLHSTCCAGALTCRQLRLPSAHTPMT